MSSLENIRCCTKTMKIFLIGFLQLPCSFQAGGFILWNFPHGDREVLICIFPMKMGGPGSVWMSFLERTKALWQCIKTMCFMEFVRSLPPSRNVSCCVSRPSNQQLVTVNLIHVGHFVVLKAQPGRFISFKLQEPTPANSTTCPSLIEEEMDSDMACPKSHDHVRHNQGSELGPLPWTPHQVACPDSAVLTLPCNFGPHPRFLSLDTQGFGSHLSKAVPGNGYNPKAMSRREGKGTYAKRQKQMNYQSADFLLFLLPNSKAGLGVISNIWQPHLYLLIIDFPCLCGGPTHLGDTSFPMALVCAGKVITPSSFLFFFPFRRNQGGGFGFSQRTERQKREKLESATLCPFGCISFQPLFHFFSPPYCFQLYTPFCFTNQVTTECPSFIYLIFPLLSLVLIENVFFHPHSIIPQCSFTIIYLIIPYFGH